MRPPEFNSYRSAVFGTGGMVATSQPLATAAGLEILAKGGNAADACLAAAAALNVTEPCSTGLGGDMFALFYDAQTCQVTALNGSGRAPAALTLERLQREGLNPNLPPLHPYTVTVPGACAGWFDLHERHGTLSMSDILAPAIHLAEKGFPVAPLTAYFWQRGAERQLRQAWNGQELTIAGRGPNPGEMFRNPGLARTLRTIAEGGKQAFYQGEIAQAIVHALQQAGGCMTLEDLASHVSTWETPASVSFGNFRVYECPPNGQGITALLALNILEGFDVGAYPALSVERLHLEIEALRLAFADARRYVADYAMKSDAPSDETQQSNWEWLLSKDYAAQRRKQINPQRASLDQQAGRPFSSSDTVYVCAVDKWGNACSFINSNYMGFGTGIVPKGWGFSLQNRGHNFSLEPHHPNCLAPRKRPYHTIIPGLITRESDGSLFGPFGVMGGFMQPQGHVQVGLALMLDGLDPQSALNLPRFCLEDGQPSDAVALEEGIPVPVMAALAEMGHPVRPTSGWSRAIFGRGQVIVREPSGILIGGSDPRADGCAMTLV
ncbi:MAG: gamma-glutamyltransferase [Anaerolineae bacterium]|nr:MAG: gamma-glutamyltransferase [Anaerolineae bacterium]